MFVEGYAGEKQLMQAMSFLDGPFHYKSVIWLVVKYSVVQKKSQGKRKLVFWAVGGLVCCFDFFYFFFCCSGAALLILLKCSR